ncbi:hypothetical protein GH714_024939 [Hevea brasiliensis]|uniref:poly(A)-specific ribonuclease n=1 Tax=Hevea brasiliensis TaxID=3981 RepID=A0A6A6KS98_HEVBR|nr:hypothetical protein GH714_024939 [Hevea brasiliensis]
MDAALHHHKVVSMDSEFPGFLRKTPRLSDELSAFADMKFNVDNMKIIQLGITLSDENGIIAGTWEFNFKFLIEMEVFYDPKSIEFLKESGIDFEELRINGIDQLFFSNMFTHVLSRHRDLKWLTFHGLYDLAYMVKLVTMKPLPVSMLDFTEIIATVFGAVCWMSSTWPDSTMTCTGELSDHCEMGIRQVWACNLMEELQKMDAALHHHKVVSMDSEFPGFLRKTPRRSDELSAFADMKFNVDNMKIIQLGITLSDENGIIAGTWEFNFKFLIETEVFYDPKSIEFLKESGIDFEELRINGIDQLFFSNMFTHVLSRHRDLKWLTFHGLYDLAYMVKLVTKKPLPVSMLDFTEIIATVFGCCVLDVKYMARLYDDLHRGELGLEKLAKILGVKRVGGSHHAGSDSLLTARVFARMKTMYGIEESRFEGFLYGVTTRICEPVRTQVLPTFPGYCQPGIPQLCQVLPASRYCRPMIHGVFLHPPIIQHQYRVL